MSEPSKSPDRLTFQKLKYIERCEKEGKPINKDYLEMYGKMRDDYDSRFDEEESRKNNLEYDLLTTDWILDKARANKSYAQNIYAALCNNSFIKLDIIPILTEQEWSCSWRYAGGIVADMLQEGDYIDWYCSGIRNDRHTDDPESSEPDRYVSEGLITDEVRKDFKQLGWVPARGGDWENFDQTNNTK